MDTDAAKANMNRKGSIVAQDIPMSYSNLAKYVKAAPEEPVTKSNDPAAALANAVNKGGGKRLFGLAKPQERPHYTVPDLKIPKLRKDSQVVVKSTSDILRQNLRKKGRFGRAAQAVKAQMALQDDDGNVKKDIAALASTMSALAAVRSDGQDETEEGMAHVQTTGRRRRQNHVPFPPMDRKRSVIMFGNRKRSTINFGRMARELKHTDPGLFDDPTLQEILKCQSEIKVTAGRKTSWVIGESAYGAITKRKSTRRRTKKRKRPPTLPAV